MKNLLVIYTCNFIKDYGLKAQAVAHITTSFLHAGNVPEGRKIFEN